MIICTDSGGEYTGPWNAQAGVGDQKVFFFQANYLRKNQKY